ncbi:MAG: hypothetical protein EP330_05100 [Deltaproteobacteria bacterium]|nr:MAG: hypothetical protein EP330_05100 [Deltaproteobacteria bacterium]
MTTLLLFAALSFAHDGDLRQVDAGLFGDEATGIAYLTSRVEGRWYVEAVERDGTLVLERSLPGSLSEADAVRIALATRDRDEAEVELTSGRVHVKVTERSVEVSG